MVCLTYFGYLLIKRAGRCGTSCCHCQNIWKPTLFWERPHSLRRAVLSMGKQTKTQHGEAFGMDGRTAQDLHQDWRVTQQGKWMSWSRSCMRLVALACPHLYIVNCVFKFFIHFGSRLDKWRAIGSYSLATPCHRCHRCQECRLMHAEVMTFGRLHLWAWVVPKWM